VQASETVRLDLAQGGSEAGVAAPMFQGASADGTRVFFTDTQQLTPGASEAGADLYECRIFQEGDATKCDLHDLTPAGSEAADVQGLVSALGEDGNSVYFVANGVLAPGAAAGSCEPSESAPASAACSLYVARFDGSEWSTTFIATLSNRDAVDWGFPPYLDNPTSSLLAAAASPSGRYLTFMSDRSLTGYDNVDAVSGVADQEIFLYDSAAASLRCVSCGATGGRPHGSFFDGGVAPLSDWGVVWPKTWIAANLPDPQHPENATTALYRPRVVLDNGRVFFNAFDSLVAADSNGNWDAYEYEPTGLGSCGGGAASSGTASVAGGCVSLLSSGVSNREAGVLDASASGDDVFILTASSLAPADKDSAYDVYDAHVCGSGWQCQSPAAPAPVCRGEACLPPPVKPGDRTPASATFTGKGNLKVRKHHRKRKHHKHHRRGHRRHGSRK